METIRACGCKGIRTCLICEAQYNISKPNLQYQLQKCFSYVYCPLCNKCWPGWDVDLNKGHPYHEGKAIDFPGVSIKLDFLSNDEATELVKVIDEIPWELSQSGRRKQNFGPKCNFKKQRLRLGSFSGFPKSTEFVQKKFLNVPLLRDFQTIEQCTLEYDPERGASIDPHIDDCWIWGERIVTVNILGDSVLTMTRYNGPTTRYNLECVSKYLPTGEYMNESRMNDTKQNQRNVVVRLPMPAKSLLVLYGEARYNWEHAVLRGDIQTRRVCLAYREFTPPYLTDGEYSKEASDVLAKASIFW